MVGFEEGLKEGFEVGVGFEVEAGVDSLDDGLKEGFFEF
jgi:hypothetical protein